jgi:hypothetical protein
MVSPAVKKPLEKKVLPIGGRDISILPLDQPAPVAAPPAESDKIVTGRDEVNGALVRQGASRLGAGAQGYMAQAPTVHGPSTQAQQEWHGSQQAVPYPPAPSAPATGTTISTGADFNKVKANGAADAKSAAVNANAITVVEQSSAALPLMEQEVRPAPSGVSTNDLDGASKMAAPAGFAMKAARLKLPSGLAIRSIAMGMHRTLAIDSAGAVFLSKDGGMNWKPVTRPWAGHPVLARFREAPPSSNEGLAKKATGGPANEPSTSNGMSVGVIGGVLKPTGTFEIVTDSGQVWTSADGEDWKTK